jgi:hypothetical protein
MFCTSKIGELFAEMQGSINPFLANGLFHLVIGEEEPV